MSVSHYWNYEELGMEPRASQALDKHSASEIHSQFTADSFQDHVAEALPPREC